MSWSCSVCGLCENILLSETASDSNSSIDEEVTEEMKQIVSNMTIKVGGSPGWRSDLFRTSRRGQGWVGDSGLPPVKIYGTFQVFINSY